MPLHHLRKFRGKMSTLKKSRMGLPQNHSINLETWLFLVLIGVKTWGRSLFHFGAACIFFALNMAYQHKGMVKYRGVCVFFSPYHLKGIGGS